MKSAKIPLIITFDEKTAVNLEIAGGKGGTLARLFQAGFSVPYGFIIAPTAFDGDELLPEAWEQIQYFIKRILKKDRGASFAVRSSALAEDSVRASFGGQFETVLDVVSDADIHQAIKTVRQSRSSERVQAYSKAKGLDFEHEIAVVVQKLIRTDISGVLFTKDPVSGDNKVVGNYVKGMGDKLVSGTIDAHEFSFKRPKGRYHGPAELQKYANDLLKLALSVEKELGCSQDIEWGIMKNKIYLLQSRPITTLTEYDPSTGEWNSTFTGDYLWTNSILGEVFPKQMTPLTWSMWEMIYSRLSFGDTPTIGNIAYNPYLNYSLTYSLMIRILRKHERVMGLIGDSIGEPPKGMEVPLTPISLKNFFFKVIPREIRTEMTKRKLKKNISTFLPMSTTLCQEMRQKIQETKEKEGLISIWTNDIVPHFIDLFTLQDSLNEDCAQQIRSLKKELTTLFGETEANTLLSTISSDSQNLASIGPLIGLSKVKSGELSREEYFHRYGHRGPYENYLEEPRPYEDPNWVDEKLESLDKSSGDIIQLIEKRDSEFNEIWEKIGKKLKLKQQKKIKQKIDELKTTTEARESTRSELTRIISVNREFYLRSGKLTDLDENIFYLTVDEVFELLSGNISSIANIPARQETYEKYSSLPPLPGWIRGRFDPFKWAADPNRRVDVFDPQSSISSEIDSGNAIKGHPGSAGRVEGIVRRIDSLDESEDLQTGEILVTKHTNIGWTILFPRATAIITDIGASLSHAAIVARELGIPAVVGCYNATARLKTGDRVLVDGSQGLVKILES
ncbi:MAG: PEP/pyruvate-binding domain-containing protein [Candidatus Hodarchaeales archaeon]|jgi:pyruvate,water dikinase